MPQKRGLAATGILAGMSKAAGFSSVSDLLQKNPEAKRPPSASLDSSQPTVIPFPVPPVFGCTCASILCLCWRICACVLHLI